MPNPAYRIEQAIFWPIIIIGITLETYQVYLAKKHNVVQSKLFIHLAFGLEMISWFPHLIDPWGVNKISTLFVDLFFSDLASFFSMIGFTFVIYSHFQVHYLAVKRLLPSAMPHIFAGLAIFYGVSIILSDIIVYGAGVSAVRIWGMWAMILFSLAVFVLDFIGFIILYRLMKEMLEKSTSPNMPHGGDNRFEILMRRLKRFHGVILPVLAFLILVLVALAASGPVNFGPKTPDEYALPGMMIACLMVYFPLTWWSWISATSPHGSMQGAKSNDNSSKAPTKMSSANTTHPQDEIEPQHLQQTPRAHSPSVGGEDEPMLASSSATPSGGVPSVLQNTGSVLDESGQPSSSKYIFNPHIDIDSPSKMQESRFESGDVQDKV